MPSRAISEGDMHLQAYDVTMHRLKTRSPGELLAGFEDNFQGIYEHLASQ